MTGTGRLIIGAVAGAIVFFGAGFAVGWYAFQANLAASLNDAAADIEAGLDEEVPAEEFADEPTEEDLPEAVAIGKSASDGFWDIKVTGVERKDAVSGSYSNAKADEDWEFLILDVEFTNASDAPQTVDIDTSEVMDADGSRYAYHSDAAYALDEEDALYEEPNPQQSFELRIPFEVPAGQKMDKALLTGTYDETGLVVVDISGE
ncbi:hypothetical protein GCM10009799_42960 [Nocardiopsis rhodophaea]|uniref:DUF4352 domain-containing protein n=1 Tax=Nocardiopsis rhodophaea TaxID=280238 RepID=A0ABN2TJM8_9ACTN